MNLLRRALANACLVPGVVLVYAGFVLCAAAYYLEPAPEEQA